MEHVPHVEKDQPPPNLRRATVERGSSQGDFTGCGFQSWKGHRLITFRRDVRESRREDKHTTTTRARAPDGTSRRRIERRTRAGDARLLGYLLAATLAAAAQIGLGTTRAPAAGRRTPGRRSRRSLRPQRPPHRRGAATADLLTVTINETAPPPSSCPLGGTARASSPRRRCSIAEELDLPLDRIRVTLADARPELVFNQLTGGSNTTVLHLHPRAGRRCDRPAAAPRRRGPRARCRGRPG